MMNHKIALSVLALSGLASNFIMGDMQQVFFGVINSSDDYTIHITSDPKDSNCTMISGGNHQSFTVDAKSNVSIALLPNSNLPCDESAIPRTYWKNFTYKITEGNQAKSLEEGSFTVTIKDGKSTVKSTDQGDSTSNPTKDSVAIYLGSQSLETQSIGKICGTKDYKAGTVCGQQAE